MMTTTMTTMKQSTETRDNKSVPRRDRGGMKGVERNHVVVIEIQNADMHDHMHMCKVQCIIKWMSTSTIIILTLCKEYND